MLQKVLVSLMLIMLISCSAKSSYRAVYLGERGGPNEVRLDERLCKQLTVTLTPEYYILGYICGDNMVSVHFPVTGIYKKEFNPHGREKIKTN